MNRSVASIGLVAALAITLGGCSLIEQPPSAPSSDSTTPASPPPASPEMTAALADGNVSHDEYVAGFRRYAACLLKDGFTISEDGEQYAKLSYSVPAAAVDSGADRTCYTFEFGGLDEAWQIAHQDESELHDVLQKCLIAAGMDGNGTQVDLEQRVTKANMSIDECYAKQNK